MESELIGRGVTCQAFSRGPFQLTALRTDGGVLIELRRREGHWFADRHMHKDFDATMALFSSSLKQFKTWTAKLPLLQASANTPESCQYFDGLLAFHLKMLGVEATVRKNVCLHHRSRRICSAMRSCGKNTKTQRAEKMWELAVSVQRVVMKSGPLIFSLWFRVLQIINSLTRMRLFGSPVVVRV